MSSRGTGKTKSLSAAGKTSHPGHTQHKTGSHKKSAGRARTKNGKNKNMEGNNLSAELAIIDLNDNNHPQNDDDQTSDPIDNPQTKSDNNNDVVVKDKIDIGLAEMEKKLTALNAAVDVFIGSDTRNVVIDTRNKVRRKSRQSKLEPGAKSLAESILIKRESNRNDNHSSLSSCEEIATNKSQFGSELSIAVSSVDDLTSQYSVTSGYSSLPSSQSSRPESVQPGTSQQTNDVTIVQID